MSEQLILPIDRGTPALVSSPSGVYVELQMDGVFTGFMPTEEEVAKCVVDSVPGATEDILDISQIDILDNTYKEHHQLFRLGVKELVEVYKVPFSDDDIDSAYATWYEHENPDASEVTL